MNVPVVGEVFAGKYAIEAVVGRGGMGVVLAARHLELEERVAIKLILSDDGPKAADFVARFVREAKLASKIKNEHVVRVIDVARLESGEPYIVMELLEGQDLSELLAQHGPLPLELAALYLLQACEAIAEAHALGIVHRDLKPANLFLTTRRDGRPCVKVLDFGISKLVGDAGQAMTKTNALLGSPYYMSPDQLVQSRDVDARSDVWALGVILFELLTKRYPFDAEDAPQLIAHILHTPPPSLATVRPDLPPALGELVAAALVKDRTQRIQDVAEFSRRLAVFAPEAGRYSLQVITGTLSRQSGALPKSALPAGSSGAWGAASPTASPSGAPGTTAPGASVTLPSSGSGGRTAVIVAVLGAVVAVVVGAVFAFRGRGVAPSSAESSPVAATAPVAVSAPAALPAPTVSVALPVLALPVESAVAPPTSAVPTAVATPAPKAANHPAPGTGAARPNRAAPHVAAGPDPFGGVR
ncbi:MAG TPA: protein kinase [Polyangiaceae bacterium]|nr:protein kinase [Polyangiaceae bacterium]